MNQSKPTQPQDSGSIAGEKGKGDSFLVSDDHVLYRSSPAHQNPYLSSYFIREGGKKQGNFRGEDLLRRDFSSIDVSDLFELIRF